MHETATAAELRRLARDLANAAGRLIALADAVDPEPELHVSGTEVSAPTPPRTEVYTIQQVAEMLSISRPSVYRLISSEVLPTVYVGSRQRILREDLEAFLASAHRT